MSPSTAAAVADPPSSPPVARPNYKLLPIESLTGSLLNPRKHFDAGKLQELADSFRGSPDGIIEPLVVRRSKDFCGSPYKAGDPTIYEIVAGERRYRAAKLAKLPHVPAIVRELTDDQVLEIMVIENNQREDVNALEEAEGFHALLARGYDIDKLAERLGRSKKYVYDRVKLLELIPEAKRLVLEGQITAGHAILIARQTPADQQRIVDPNEAILFNYFGAADEDGQEMRGVRELQRRIQATIRLDPSAPIVQDLFPETASAVASAATVVHITHEYYTREKGIVCDGDWKYADGIAHDDEKGLSKTCKHSVLGVVVLGRDQGQAFQVCVNKRECDVHWKQERADRAARDRTKSAPSRGAEKAEAVESVRREREQRRKQQEKVEHDRAVFSNAAPRIFDAFVARIKALGIPALIKFLRDSLPQRTGEHSRKAFGSPTVADGFVRLMAGSSVEEYVFEPWFAHQRVPGLARQLGVDLKPILAGGNAQTSAQAKSKKPAKAKKPAARKAAKKR